MRLLNKIFAFMFGYFWLPCPICGRMFGGHEIADTVLIGHGPLERLVCKKCNNEALRRNRRAIRI